MVLLHGFLHVFKLSIICLTLLQQLNVNGWNTLLSMLGLVATS